MMVLGLRAWVPVIPLSWLQLMVFFLFLFFIYILYFFNVCIDFPSEFQVFFVLFLFLLFFSNTVKL